eukprot:IDg11747t1
MMQFTISGKCNPARYRDCFWLRLGRQQSLARNARTGSHVKCRRIRAVAAYTAVIHAPFVGVIRLEPLGPLLLARAGLDRPSSSLLAFLQCHSPHTVRAAKGTLSAINSSSLAKGR